MDEIRIRDAQASDGDAVIEMAERLQEGVAPWRDPQEVRRAVIGWVRESLADLGDPDARAFVAERNGEVVGFVCAMNGLTSPAKWTPTSANWSWRRTPRGAELDGRWSKPPRTGSLQGAPAGRGGHGRGQRACSSVLCRPRL